MLNAMPTLKRCLGDVIANDSIVKTERDTLLKRKQYKLITFGLPSKSLDYYSKFRSFSAKITKFYSLIIDPATDLPYQIVENNSTTGNAYVLRVTFTRINLSPAAPKQNAWYYSTYEKDYKRAKKKEAIPLIAVGSLLPEIALPQMGTPTTTPVVPAVKNKIVMIDFWIKNCGYCMASFPHLKELQAKYGQRNLQILTINAEDSRQDVDFFLQTRKTRLPDVLQGKVLARKLGVDDRGYPTVILADTNGKVVYAGDFEKEKLTKLIDKML